jgi:hypothetical protein
MNGLSKFLVFLSTCISKSGQNGPFYMVYSNQYFFQIQKIPPTRSPRNWRSPLFCQMWSYVICHTSYVRCGHSRLFRPSNLATLSRHMHQSRSASFVTFFALCHSVIPPLFSRSSLYSLQIKSLYFTVCLLSLLRGHRSG